MRAKLRSFAGVAGAAALAAALTPFVASLVVAEQPAFGPRRACAPPLVASAPTAPATTQVAAAPTLRDPDQTGAVSPRDNPYDTRIVVVEWKIKPGQECDFLNYWATRSTVPDRSGLVAEFLSEVDQKPWIRWTLEDNATTYYNVGIWKTGDAFQDQIGKFIDNNRPPLGFEAAKRGRIFLAPERWRIGQALMPRIDAAGVQ